MRNYENANKLKNNKIELHNILFTYTSEIDYEMSRHILLESVEGINYNEYLILEGYHCSCYDFDETDWTGTVYTEEELKKLATVDYNKDNIFWNMIKNYFG